MVCARKELLPIENLVDQPVFHRLPGVEILRAVDVLLNFFHRLSNTLRQNFELKTCGKSATKLESELGS
jgi:hypothetical protein